MAHTDTDRSWSGRDKSEVKLILLFALTVALSDALVSWCESAEAALKGVEG